MKSEHVTTEHSLERRVRRLRVLAAVQFAVFLYALLVLAATCSLALAHRWECWVLIPLPAAAGVLLAKWGHWVLGAEPIRMAPRPRWSNGANGEPRECAGCPECDILEDGPEPESPNR